jgi:hypothetical protein
MNLHYLVNDAGSSELLVVVRCRLTDSSITVWQYL